jgi:hypothetical protein
MLWAAVTFALAGCNWRVSAAEPNGSAERDPTVRSVAPISFEANCGDDAGLAYEGTGQFGCGEVFATEMWGECNDCSDRGCTDSDEGIAHCACFGVVEYCFPNPQSDSGVYERCHKSAAQCECDDGKGPIYECSCEGHASTPSECGCGLPRDYSADAFDFEFECENPRS